MLNLYMPLAHMLTPKAYKENSFSTFYMLYLRTNMHTNTKKSHKKESLATLARERYCEAINYLSASCASIAERFLFNRKSDGISY